jgi:hypothetical protein
MNPSPSRPAAAFTAILLASGFLAGCASARSGITVPASSRAANAAASQGTTVVVDCSGQRQTRPSSFVLTCADANDALTALHWASWADGQAFGTGTETVNTCTPDCADGKLVSYPALITLWRPAPLPGHPGVRYFTRITRIYPFNRPPLYDCQGKHTCYPQTSTSDLGAPS